MAKKPQSDSIIDMFARLGHDMRLPEVDIERVIEHNRRNLEAFEKSAQAASAGASSVMKKQREVLQDALREANELMRSMQNSDPRDVMSRQAEFARRSFETAVRNTGEVASLMHGSSSEALEILRARIHDGMEEIREGFRKKV